VHDVGGLVWALMSSQRVDAAAENPEVMRQGEVFSPPCVEHLIARQRAVQKSLIISAGFADWNPHFSALARNETHALRDDSNVNIVHSFFSRK
jgi:hypothetical protein